MNIISKTPDTGIRIIMAEVECPSLEGYAYIPDKEAMWYVKNGTYLRSRYIAGMRVWWRGYASKEERT